MRPLALLAAAPLLAASLADARAQSCAPATRPAFEFQVQQPVAFVGDSAARPRPAAQRFVRLRDDPSALVVQFVVDTLGHPQSATFKVLNAPSAAAADSARAALPGWRFTPAIRAGCKVPQLLQTALER